MESWIMWLVLICWHLFLFHFSFSHSLCHPHDSFALLHFKASFPINATYYYTYGCPVTNLKTETWGNGTDCCSWLGVTCHPISGHVTGLDLSCSGLYGEIHENSSLFGLSHLQSLNLAFNDFNNSQISPLFGGLVSLTYLNLSSSYFEGEIPPQISHLSKLESLDLSLPYDYRFQLKWKDNTWKRLLQNATLLRELVLNHTDLSLTSMRPLNQSSLVTLSLRGTGLRGKLTDDILCLPNLQHLSLSGNFDLHGQLPNLSCSAASLTVLQIATCGFQGSIPPSFSNFTHLTSLDLSVNYLHGSIPSSLLTLPSLTFLYLYMNHLSGQIPNVFHHSNRFEVLDLSYNYLGGELPSTLPNLQSLVYLDLESNKLEGPLPNKVTTGFVNLAVLVLHDNLLNGTIPSWCFSLPSLRYLYLSDNQFTGHIPVISSYSLQSLFLCQNKLQGNIPNSIFSLVNLTYICLSSNNFSGTVNFSLFSKFQNLRSLELSQLSQLSLNFESNVKYGFPYLQQLGLSSMGLTEFPNLSRKVPTLTILDLSNNKLNGMVPNWLYEIDSLYALTLSHNLLTTPMDQLSRNYQPSYLDLSFNLLTGDISSSICNSSSMEILNLSHNKLTGIIPQCLVNLLSLRVMDLQMNKLYGSLPNSFSKNSSLMNLHLNDNQLQGLFPRSLSNCTQLQVLNLANNQIEDTFPNWLQTLPNLKVLVLRENKLHGLIESSKSKLGFPSLVIFDISSNNFNGPIPKSYIQNFEAMKNVAQDEVADSNSQQYMQTSFRYGIYTSSVTETIKAIYLTYNKIPTNLANIDLSRNKFEGEIPNLIGELHALRGLNVSHNRLSGPIPQAVENLTNLESLDLSSNMLTGRIPKELVNLKSLEVLNLSYNRLVGEIPQGKQFDTFSNVSYEGNFGLCGVPLTMKCNKDPEQHSQPSENLWREERFGFGWKPVAIGYGCGMLFGVGIGSCVFLTRKPQWIVRMVEG